MVMSCLLVGSASIIRMLTCPKAHKSECCRDDLYFRMLQLRILNQALHYGG